MSPIDKLEPKLGRLAIPGILKIIALFQVLVYVLLAMTSKGDTLSDSSFYTLLTLDPSILRGQVWRLFTFMFLPMNDSPLFVLITALFLTFISNSLEEAWGAFKLNVFVFTGMAFVALGVLLLGAFPTGIFLFSVFIMAAAVVYPEYQILLMLIIPIKLKWVGILTFATLVFLFIGSPPPFQLTILLSLLNFALFFGPSAIKNFKQRGTAAARKHRFEASMPSPDEAFHTCHTCGKTDASDPEEEFRVAADGEEYCSGCRPT